MRIEGLYDRGFFVNFDEGDEALYRTSLFYLPTVGDIYHTISEGDTLLTIAQKHYGNQALWYLIADANESIEDIFDLTQSDTIVVPNVSTIFGMYG